MTTLITLSAIFFYFVLAGLFGRYAYVKVRNDCLLYLKEKKTGERSNYSFERCEAADHPTPFFMGAFWPLAAPMIIGMWIGDYWAEAPARREQKRKKLQEDYEKAKEMLKDLNVDWDLLRSHDD